MRFHQRHFGFHCRCDIGADQSGCTATDHDQITIKRLRTLPARIDAAFLHILCDLFSKNRKNTQQGKGEQQSRRQNARQRIDIGQLRACIHIDQRAGQHADLTDPIKGNRAQRREPQQQVNQKKREDRYQTQGKQIERPVSGNAVIDRFQLVTETTLNRVVQQETRYQKGQCCTDARGKGYQQRTRHHSEQSTCRQRHDCSPRQRQRRNDDITHEEQCDDKPW